MYHSVLIHSSFKIFAIKAEAIANEVSRRLELDVHYKLLIKAVFEAIERIALSHYKTPPHVIRFGTCYKWPLPNPSV